MWLFLAQEIKMVTRRPFGDSYSSLRSLRANNLSVFGSDTFSQLAMILVLWLHKYKRGTFINSFAYWLVADCFSGIWNCSFDIETILRDDCVLWNTTFDHFVALNILNSSLTITIVESKDLDKWYFRGYQLTQYELFANKLHRMVWHSHQNYQIVMEKYDIVGQIKHLKAFKRWLTIRHMSYELQGFVRSHMQQRINTCRVWE
jgi:hypothetical protein